jgi:outer membrane receptor for monomeric catechols
MPKVKQDAQMEFKERFLEDGDLADLIEERMENMAAATAYSRTNAKLREKIAELNLEDGIRYRVNGFVFRLSTNVRDQHSVAGGKTRRFAELKAVDHGTDREED